MSAGQGLGPIDLPTGDDDRDELGARYEVGDAIGHGGMGEVRIARDRRLRRAVAVKIGAAGSAGTAMMRRFLREARITSQLEHPNVPPVYDFGVSSGGRLYFSMQNVRGRTLAEVAKDPTVSLTERLAIFVKVCDVVAFAHSRGVIHRDLKLQNVMVGSFGRVYVIDWGIAKLVGEHEEGLSQELDDDVIPDGERTQDGALVGTLSCMSPEQAAGTEIDVRSDVYSLGVMLYRLLAGSRSPYATRGHLHLLRAVVTAEVVPLRSVARGVPWELAAITHRALAARPDDRYASVSDLRDDVGRYLDQLPVHAARYSLVSRARKWLWRRRQVLGAAALTGFLLGTLLLAAVIAWGLSLTQALGRAREAELAREGALAESLVGLAQARAEDGDSGRALELLDRAQGHFRTSGRSDAPAVYHRSWLYRDAPPAWMSWQAPDRALRPSVSPDGSRLFFARDRQGAILDLAGNVIERIETLPERGVLTTWAPEPLMVREEAGRYRGVDLKSGQTRWEFELGEPWTIERTVALDAAGTILVRSDQAHGTRAFSVATGEPASPEIPSAYLNAMSEDGSRMCVILSGAHLRSPDGAAVIETATGRVVHRPSAPACGPLSSDGKLMAEVDHDNVQVVEVDTSRLLWRLEIPHAQLAFSPDSAHVLVAGLDGQVTRRDARTGVVERERRIVAGGSRTQGAILALADDESFLTVDPTSARLWSFPRLGHRPSVYTDTNPTGLAVSPGGHLVATVGFEGVLRVWHRPTLTLLLEAPISPAGARDVWFEPDGRAILVADREGVVTRLDPTAPASASRYGSPGPRIAMAARTDRGRVLVAMDDGQVNVHDLRSTDLLETWSTPLHSAWGIDLDLPRRRLGVGGRKASDAAFAVLDLDSGEVAFTSPVAHGVYRIEFDPEGRLALSSHIGQPMMVERDLLTPRTVPPQDEVVQAVAFSSDGGLLAIGDYAGTLTLLRTADMAEMLRVQLAERSVVDVRFVRDLPAFAAISGDGMLHTVDLALAPVADAGTSRRSSPADATLVSVAAQARAAAATRDWERALALWRTMVARGEPVDPLDLAVAAWGAGEAEAARRALDEVDPARSDHGEIAFWRSVSAPLVPPTRAAPEDRRP